MHRLFQRIVWVIYNQTRKLVSINPNAENELSTFVHCTEYMTPTVCNMHQIKL